MEAVLEALLLVYDNKCLIPHQDALSRTGFVLSGSSDIQVMFSSAANVESTHSNVFKRIALCILGHLLRLPPLMPQQQ